MNYLGAPLIGVLVQALIIYVILRLAHQTNRPDAAPLRVARRHAIWAAVIALFVGPVFGTPPLQLLRSPSTYTGLPRSDWSTLPEDLAATAIPFLALGGVYILAQFTGPIGGGSLRMAELTVRRLRDYLPLRLTIYVGSIVLLGAVSIALVSALPSITPPDRPLDAPVDSYVPAPLPRPDGGYFATVAGLSYGLFIVGVVSALLVIVRRRRVPTLTHVEDSIMRRVFINRLLRSAALVGVIVISNCLDFGAVEPSETDWAALRILVAALGLLTVIVIIAARPPVTAEDVDAEPAHGVPAPSGTALRAGEVLRSARWLGYTAWCLGMIPLLLTLGAPLGGLLTLTILSLAYLAFYGSHVIAELALAQNHSDAPQLHWHNARRLRPTVRVVAVATLAAMVVLAGLGSWVTALPDSSRELPFWFVAYGLVMAASVLAIAFSATRPAVRAASIDEDDALRAASVRRVLLMTWSAMLALSAFLLSENRYALAPTSTGSFDDPYPAGQGQLGALIVALFIAAVVVAILPGRTRQAVPAAQPAGTAR